MNEGITRRGLCKAAVLGAVSAPLLGAQESEDLAMIGKTERTQFAINVEMWWRKLPFLKRIEETAKLGFPAIEFWPWRNKDLDAIKRLCTEHGLEVAQFTAWPFTPGMNNPKNHDKVAEEITDACKTANFLDCKLMTVVGGNDQPGMTQEEMLIFNFHFC